MINSSFSDQSSPFLIKSLYIFSDQSSLNISDQNSLFLINVLGRISDQISTSFLIKIHSLVGSNLISNIPMVPLFIGVTSLVGTCPTKILYYMLRFDFYHITKCIGQVGMTSSIPTPLLENSKNTCI